MSRLLLSLKLPVFRNRLTRPCMAVSSIGMRFLRFVIAFFLLPAIAAEALSIYSLMPSMLTLSFPYLSKEMLAVIGGYCLLIIFFFFIPIPISIYVFGHELTHAVWGFLTGSKVGRIHISSKGGYCTVSDPGMFTTLAPYFVPFYLVVLLLIKVIAGIWLPLEDYALWWLVGVGVTYGFHFVYTVKMLVEVEQPDVREYGHFFSYTLIVLFNLLILGAGLVFITGTSFLDFGAKLLESLAVSYCYCFNQILSGVVWLWKVLVNLI